MKKESSKEKIIVIYGPTWSGKTSMSIDIAKYLNTKIIGTDSRQIFKYLDIWTGKITEKEKEGIEHFMIDIIKPTEKYSVWEFKQQAELHIQEIYEQKQIPILCGGTGLYIDSLIYDFDIPKVPADEALRKKLEDEAAEFGVDYVYNRLIEYDPEYAKELHPNNLQYVIRALEVVLLTWKSKTEFRGDRTLKYDVLFLTPDIPDREYLYNRINKRVGMMFDDGLIEEVKSLLQTYNKDDFWMKTIWYSEVIRYLEWEMTEEECLELVRKHNRNYAKRQYTWFRKYKEEQFN